MHLSPINSRIVRMSNKVSKYAALVGDVIASRQTGDRENLQSHLATSMTAVNQAISSVQPLTMTVGDECQGLYEDLATSLMAALRIRFALYPVDVRLGIGWGELTLPPESPPFGQDGPCWWRAREAIEEVKIGERSNATARATRTICRTGTDIDSLVNSYLSARDQIFVGFDEIDVQIALLNLAGSNQREIARSVGLSQGSVSRRLQGHGLFSLLDDQPDLVPMGPE